MKQLALVLFLVPIAALAQPTTTPRNKTIDNLDTAIAGEANASHRYALFARKADEERYTQVAKLFRAASRAEAIHERNHEKVLRELGQQPKRPELEEVRVGTTRENLEVPVKGEAHEQEEMYPAFIAQARKDNVPAAVRSFTYALETEAEHLKLFQDALANLGHNPAVDYFVGSVSGDTVTKPTNREPYTKID